MTQAAGPIAGGIPYDGVIETSNDVDWFFFYISGQRQFEVVLRWRGGSGCSVNLALRDRTGDEQGFTRVDNDPEDTVGRVTLTSAGSARYNLEVKSECVGEAYTIQVTPADAVMGQPPIRCFNHVHGVGHVHTRRHRHIRRHRHVHRRRHRHSSGRIHIHRTHFHRAHISTVGRTPTP